MVGGLLQLKEKGAQDIYLTGNPQITFFKIVYRRHTNFSVESILQTWTNNPSSEQLNTRCIIGRKGDLISKMYIQDIIYKDNNLPLLSEKNIGYDQINNVNIQIGSQIIDEHTNNWLETYAELTQKNEYGSRCSILNAICMNDSHKDYNLNSFGLSNYSKTDNMATKFQSLTLAGGVDGITDGMLHIPDEGDYFSASFNGSVTSDGSNGIIRIGENNIINNEYLKKWNSKGLYNLNSSGSTILNFNSDAEINDINSLFEYSEYLNNNPIGYIYVPLQFWFCRNPGLALPLIALQYNEVIININFKKIINNPELYVDYIFLDTDERRRFAQISHEYLIEQVQIRRSSPGLTHNLKFKNPVKELIWVSSTDSNISKADYGYPLIGDWKLIINGIDRFSYRDISYFTKQQIYDYHTGYGGVTVKNSIAVYSFSLYPEDHQPSGTMNFSNIQNSYLMCRSTNNTDNEKLIIAENQNIIVYAVNYNILRILSGQGSLAYTN